jgi:LruC domain-containing protein
MIRTHRLFLLVAVMMTVVITSCHKDPDPTPVDGPKKMEDLKVPATFNWESSKVINLNIGVNLPDAVGLLSKITVYDGNPLEGGLVLLTGSAGYNYLFVSTVRIPTAVKNLYFEMKTGDGSVQLVSVPVAETINYTFIPGTKSGLKSAQIVTDPDCNSGCDGTPTAGSFVISNGKTYCITGAYNGSISINKGKLKICGTFNGTINMSPNGNDKAYLVITGGGNATIGSLSMGKNCYLEVYTNSTATIGSFTLNQNAQVMNLGTVTINANFNPNDLVTNYGTMTVNGTYNMNGSSGVLENAGTLYINNGHWNAINEVTNTGLIDVTGDINFNNSDVYNECAIISHENINFNNVDYISDAGFVRAYLGATANGGTNMTLKNKSMVMATDLIVNNDIKGQGSTNVIKATNSARINGNKYIDGPIEFLTPNGTLENGSYPANFKNGATLKAIANTTVVIPVSECNPEGNQPPTPPTNDRDGDGVPDNLDDYPDDPTRAYDNYYPAKNKFGSLAFEDLWPSKGDYDLNDMVIDCNYWYITNAQNKVVDVKPTFYIRAVGAFLQNGFGWQFDGVVPAAIASVTGQKFNYGYISNAANGTENNQEKAVIIVIDNVEQVIHRTGGSFFNTEQGFPLGVSDTIRINLHFATPQNQSDVGAPPYNPFIIKDMQRNVEIHLPDHVPTSLMDPALFGTGDDDSDPATGKYYKSKDNHLPWAISIPDSYAYTWEQVQIVYGNLKFGPWAESGGTSFTDWYKDLPGYRDQSQIYAPSDK